MLLNEIYQIFFLIVASFIVFFLVAIPLSIDHKPDRSDERQRIEDAGGFIIWAGEIESSWDICV